MGLKTYFTFALAALCSQAVVACDDPEPGDGELAAPNITSISFSGNGCPQGTMNQNTTSLDNLVLGNFSTEVASTVSPIEKTKNCQLHINFSGDNPPDYQFSVKDLILKGYLILESGAAATVYVTTYWSQDAGKTETTQQSLENDDEELPRTGFVEVKAAGNDLWSPCNSKSPGILNINTRVAMAAQRKADNTTAYGYFGKYEIPAAKLVYPVQESIEFKWRKCNDTEVAHRSRARLNTQ